MKRRRVVVHGGVEEGWYESLVEEWELFELVEDYRFDKALELLSMHPRLTLKHSRYDGWWCHGESLIGRLCGSGCNDSQHTEHLRLVRECLDRGADPCLPQAHYSAVRAMVESGALDMLQYVFLERGSRFRGGSAQRQLELVREYSFLVYRQGVPPVWLGHRFSHAAYMSVLHKADRMLRKARASQNWQALLPKARLVGKVCVYVRSLYEHAIYLPGGRGFKECKARFEALA